MTILEGLKKIIRKEKPLIDVWHYLLGNYRYWLHYRLYNKNYYKNPKGKHLLIRQHIYEQIIYRIDNMNKECYYSGSCIKCGCDTTQLQMANKACKGLEYPPMMNRRNWKRFLEGRHQPRYKEYIWIYMPAFKKHYLFKETIRGYVQTDNN